MNEETIVTYIGRQSQEIPVFYQCDDCGFSEILSGFTYCPNCGKKIVYQ